MKLISVIVGVTAAILVTACGGGPSQQPAQNTQIPFAAAPADPVQTSTPATVASSAPVSMAPAAPAPAAPVRTVRTSPPVSEPEYRPRTVTTRRSKKASAAIIGGSAAAGAAIGALAGGGKGAAIGAIAGGAGGLVYDRTTATKTRKR